MHNICENSSLELTTHTHIDGDAETQLSEDLPPEPCQSLLNVSTQESRRCNINCEMYSTHIVSVDISSVVQPPKLQKCGRPKGATKSAIGIPSKKKAKIAVKTVPFGKNYLLKKNMVSL
uniref:Uncharacterized protein n=1 Tax=Amphimedon queenslandica TaxID=400682 RepID=A0A1X7TUV0_AMPQE